MEELIDEIERQAFGMSRTEAITEGVCIACHKPVFDVHGMYKDDMVYSEEGKAEYSMGGMCEQCSNDMFSANNGKWHEV